METLWLCNNKFMWLPHQRKQQHEKGVHIRKIALAVMGVGMASFHRFSEDQVQIPNGRLKTSRILCVESAKIV